MIQFTEKKSWFYSFLFRHFFYRSFRKSFYAIKVRNIENIANVISQSRKDNVPVIFCVNHSNWWDVYLSIFLSMECFKINSYVLKNIKEEPLISYLFKIGAVPNDKNNDGLETMNFLQSLLTGKPRFLWVFPQDKIADNNKAMKFTPVISDLVLNLKDVILVNCLFEYRYLDKSSPEIFIDFFESKNFAGISYLNKESFTKNLEQKFELKVKEFREKFANNDLNDFKPLMYTEKKRAKEMNSINEIT